MPGSEKRDCSARRVIHWVVAWTRQVPALGREHEQRRSESRNRREQRQRRARDRAVAHGAPGGGREQQTVAPQHAPPEHGAVGGRARRCAQADHRGKRPARRRGQPHLAGVEDGTLQRRHGRNRPGHPTRARRADARAPRPAARRRARGGKRDEHTRRGDSHPEAIGAARRSLPPPDGGRSRRRCSSSTSWRPRGPEHADAPSPTRPPTTSSPTLIGGANSGPPTGSVASGVPSSVENTRSLAPSGADHHGVVDDGRDGVERRAEVPTPREHATDTRCSCGTRADPRVAVVALGRRDEQRLRARIPRRQPEQGRRECDLQPLRRESPAFACC